MPNTPARDPWFDNAKFIILGLVVLGHLTEVYMKRQPELRLLYDGIYLFHMPAIIFLAGRFTKLAPAPIYYRRILEQVLYPYLVFQVIYRLAFQGPSRFFDLDLLLLPGRTLWFLLALAVWQAVLPWLLRMPLALPLTVAVGLGIGFVDSVDMVLSLSRIFVFLPFFLAGHLSAGHDLSWLRHLSRPLAICALAACVAAFLWLWPDYRGGLALGHPGYGPMNAGTEGAIWRLLTYGLSSLALLALLAAVPRTSRPYTFRGAQTLHIYLFHSLLIRLASGLGVLPRHFDIQAVIAATLLLVLSLWLFGSPRFARAVQPLMRLPINLFARYRKEN